MNAPQQHSGLPLLAAWEPQPGLPPQSYNYQIPRLPSNFIEKGRSLFEQCNPLYREDGEAEILTALISPSDVVNAEVKLSRPKGHRPVIESYKNAFTDQFIAESKTCSSKTISDYFGETEAISMNDGYLTSDSARQSESRDNENLYLVCSHHLPLSYSLRPTPFNGRKAIVWLCIPGETIEITPEFLCIAGWTRWCALKDAMDNLQAFGEKSSPNNDLDDLNRLKHEDDSGDAENEQSAIDYSVPVYLLDGRGLSELEIHCLSVYFNLIDSDEMEEEDQAGKKLKPSSRTYTVSGVKSRPYGLSDFLLVLDIVIESVLNSDNPQASFVITVREMIQDSVELSMMWKWICDEIWSDAEETYLSGMVSILNAPLPDVTEQLDYVCGFLTSLAYPYDYRHPNITIEMILESKIQRTCLWDRVLYYMIPYQALCSVPLSDICSIVRSVEPFMMIRSKAVMDFYKPVEWDQLRSESFVNHFVHQNESVSKFVGRLCSSEKIRELRTKNVLWPYDSLANCTCFYNYHYLIELDSEIAAADDIPDEINGGSDTNNSVIKFQTGTERALLLVRAILLYAALTFQNSAFQFQLARSDYQDAPLEKITRPKLFEEVGDNIENHKLKYAIPKAIAEQFFEGCLGIFGELVFRGICSGLGRATLYTRESELENQGDVKSNSLITLDMNEKPFLKGIMQGGALAIHYMLTAIYTKSLTDVPLDENSSSNVTVSVDAILPLLTSAGKSLSYHCFQIQNMVSCRRRIYENCVQLQTTGFDPGNFSHLNILFNVLMMFHERGIEESTETARDVLNGRSISFQLPDRGSTLELKPDLLAKAVTQIHESWIRPRPDHQMAAPRPSTQQPEAKTRIVKWFDDTKCQARDLMNELYLAFKSLDGSVVLACDFREKTPEEAKAMAGTLSELAADSTNLTSSLQEVPYQFGVMNCSQFQFSRKAVESVLHELGGSMRKNLEEGMNSYLSIPDAAEAVVISARPGVICALWQSLTHLSPFFDLLHPLACQWLSFRALFTSWLWGCIRENMMDLWRELCQEKLGTLEPGASYPALRFTLRRLPQRIDRAALNSIIDLTPERLNMLFRGPGPLDKIGAAFYRFQCSSMADARSVLGPGANGGVPLVKDLRILLSCQDPCLKSLFEDLWAELDGNLQAEDVLNDAQIAAAGFLKKYAKYVLTGMETQDRSFDAQGRRIDATTLSVNSTAITNELSENAASRTRKRKALLKDEEVSFGNRTTGGRKLDDIPRAVLAGYNTLHELKRDLKALSRTESFGGAPQQSPAPTPTDWLNRLPENLAERLRNQPVPREPLVNNIMQRLQRTLKQMRGSQSYRKTQNKRRRVDGSETTSGAAAAGGGGGEGDVNSFPDGPTSVFFNLPEWLRSTPVWSLWMSAIRKDHTSALFTMPSTNDMRAQPILDHASPPLGAMDWDIVRAVLDFLAERGVSYLYCSRTREVFPLTTRGGFADQSFTESLISESCNDIGLRPPSAGWHERRGAMDRFKSILEGDLIGYRRPLSTSTSAATAGASGVILTSANTSSSPPAAAAAAASDSLTSSLL